MGCGQHLKTFQWIATIYHLSRIHRNFRASDVRYYLETFHAYVCMRRSRLLGNISRIRAHTPECSSSPATRECTKGRALRCAHLPPCCAPRNACVHQQLCNGPLESTVPPTRTLASREGYHDLVRAGTHAQISARVQEQTYSERTREHQRSCNAPRLHQQRAMNRACKEQNLSRVMRACKNARAAFRAPAPKVVLCAHAPTQHVSCTMGVVLERASRTGRTGTSARAQSARAQAHNHLKAPCHPRARRRVGRGSTTWCVLEGTNSSPRACTSGRAVRVAQRVRA